MAQTMATMILKYTPTPAISVPMYQLHITSPVSATLYKLNQL